MRQRLKTLVPVRYAALGLGLCGLLLALARLASWGGGWPAALALLACACIVALGIHDLRQPQHAILRNYPVIGHLRFLLEYIRPEIRQYFIESDREATPFSRARRSAPAGHRCMRAVRLRWCPPVSEGWRSSLFCYGLNSCMCLMDMRKRPF